MCCGDLDDAVYLVMGAAVCVYCGHTHVETAGMKTYRPAGLLQGLAVHDPPLPVVAAVTTSDTTSLVAVQ
jgi:hypothetical protein